MFDSWAILVFKGLLARAYFFHKGICHSLDGRSGGRYDHTTRDPRVLGCGQVGISHSLEWAYTHYTWALAYVVSSCWALLVGTSRSDRPIFDDPTAPGGGTPGCTGVLA